MKKTFPYFLGIIVILTCCSKEEVQLTLFSPEAFAFQFDEGWELNASVQVKGFIQKQDDDNYFAKISYFVNLTTPTGEVLKEADYGKVEKESMEEISDLAIEVQMELDSTFEKGTYNLKFFVEDDFSSQKDTLDIPFELTD